MTETAAQDYFNKQSGDPIKRYISKADTQTGSFTTIYNDMAKLRTLECPVGNYMYTGAYVSSAALRNTAGQATLWPFWMPETRTFTTCAFFVNVAATAGQTHRLAIYTMHSNGYAPDALHVDCGTVATDTTGRKEVTGLNFTLTQGWWWGYLAAVSTVATAGTAYGSVSSMNASTASSGGVAAGPAQIYVSSGGAPSTISAANWSASQGLPPQLYMLRSA